MDLITTVSTGILAIWMLCLVSVWVLFRIYCTKLQTANIRRRTDLMRKLGRNPESQALVGFFHPYWSEKSHSHHLEELLIVLQ